jgi:hypothetical protein
VWRSRTWQLYVSTVDNMFVLVFRILLCDIELVIAVIIAHQTVPIELYY